MTFTREVLTDGKAAIRVDGAPFSPVWFRVKLLDKDIIDGAASEPPELLVKVSAYRVDASGLAMAGWEGPMVRRTITAESLALGSQAMLNERKSISKHAIKKAIRSIAEIGLVAQLGVELVD